MEKNESEKNPEYVVIAKHIANKYELRKRERDKKKYERANKRETRIDMNAFSATPHGVKSNNEYLIFYGFRSPFLPLLDRSHEQFKQLPNEILHFTVSISDSTVIVLASHTTSEQDPHTLGRLMS